MQEVILFYNGLDVPTRQILDSKGVIPTKTTADGKVAIQEMEESQLNNLGRKIKKVNEKVYAAQVGCKQCKGPHCIKDCSLKEEGKPLKKLIILSLVHLSKEGDIDQQLWDSTKETMQILPKRHEEKSNLIKEIQAFTNAAIRNQGASIKTLEIQIGQMSKVLQERGFGSLPSFTETNSRNHVKSISTTVEADMTPIRASVSVMPLLIYLNLGLGELAHTKLTVELADRTVKYPKGIAENVLVGIGKFVFPIDFIILDMPEDVKVPLILGRPFLSTAHAKIDVFKRKITLRVRDEKIIFKSMKPANSLIKRVYMLGLRECMELDLEARLMGETLVLNRSLYPSYGDYIELNDLNVPLKLRRDQVYDLMPTIKEGEVIDKPMIDIIKTKNNESFDEYPSFCDFDQKINIDCAYNLRFSCMIGDVIVGEPLCKASCVESRRVDEIITIHNGNDNVTYQMARSHPRFKHLSNAQCNKIKPLLKKDDGYCNCGNFPGEYIVGNTLRYQDLERYEALEDGKLKDKALKNKAIMEGMIDDNDESHNEGWRRWDGYENTIQNQEERENEEEHENKERCELFDDTIQKRSVCNIRRFEMIKYLFGKDEEYVAKTEHEYDDLTNTNKDACCTY
ncbi:putative reverse transcriptase domain-containing protein [Tanacetum coccineum]